MGAQLNNEQQTSMESESYPKRGTKASISSLKSKNIWIFFLHFFFTFSIYLIICLLPVQFFENRTHPLLILYIRPPLFFQTVRGRCYWIDWKETQHIADTVGGWVTHAKISTFNLSLSRFTASTIKRKRRRLRMSNKYVYLFISQTSCQDDSVLSLGNLVTETKISILRRRVIYFNPLTLRISLVILLTVCHTIHMMLV